MRILEIRKNIGIVEELRKTFSTNDWKYLRAALEEEHPIHAVTRDSSPGALARQLGVIEGYQYCLRLLDSVTNYIDPQKPLIETFEPPKPQIP